jgi:hypothetical protein
MALAASAMAMTLAAPAAKAQTQPPPPTVREYCVRIAPGKAAEFAALVRDVTVPLNQSRADAGEFAWFGATRSVVPAGSSAPCDYRMAYGYRGLPAEELSQEGLDAALKRAKLPLTGEQLLARRAALSSLVGVEVWSQVDSVGGMPEKGAYIRFNRYQVKSGRFDDWVRLERTYWKPLVDAWLKGGGKGSWSAHSRLMPGGSSLPYNALTVDVFPDWNGLLQGVGAAELWPKVHPTATIDDAFDAIEAVRSVHLVEVYQVAALVRAK